MSRRHYSVKSIFPTLQGEGHNVGRPAVFCRFSGCNLWNGLERDRHKAVCKFCDTDFVGTDGVGGGSYGSPRELADAILRQWCGSGPPFVVFTGGEPTLQLDGGLIDALHGAEAEVAVETNGTRPVAPAVDWVCVSPKAGAPLRQTWGDELKIAWPQPALDLDALERLRFQYRFLQPIDGPQLEENVLETLATCQRRPKWRVSWQLHKVLGIP